MAKGRKKDFAAKQIAGLPLEDQAHAASYGLNALTRGAKLADEILYMMIMQDEAERRSLIDQVAAAIRTLDHTTLRDMADHIESVGAGDLQKRGDRATALAADFFLHCREIEHRPTTGEVEKYLYDCMGDDAPHRRTVDRIVKLLRG